MKRILSLVLTFAMVFTTFGPSVYATGEGIAEIINDETAVEQVVENVEGEVVENVGEDANYGGVEDDSEPYEGYPMFSGEKLYVEYNVNNSGYIEWDQSTTPSVLWEDSVDLRVTDGKNIYYIESVGLEGTSQGIQTAAAYGSVAELRFNYDAPGNTYKVSLTARDGSGEREWLNFMCSVAKTQKDGIWYSKDGVEFQFNDSDSIGAEEGQTIWFYVIKSGERIGLYGDYDYNEFKYVIGDSSNDYLNSVTVGKLEYGSSYLAPVQTAPTYDGGWPEDWGGLWFFTPEPGYQYIMIDRDVAERYDQMDGVYMQQNDYFEIIFRDSGHNNVPAEYIQINEETAAVLQNKGVELSLGEDRICVDINNAQPGEYDIPFTVNGKQGEITFTVDGGIDIYINAGGLEDYDKVNGFNTSQQSGFDVIFRDGNNNNITVNNIVISEEGRVVLEKNGISVTPQTDRIHIETSMDTPTGEYTAYFTVNGTAAEIKFTVYPHFEFSGFEFAEGTEFQVPKDGTVTISIVNKGEGKAGTVEVGYNDEDNNFVPYAYQGGITVEYNGTAPVSVTLDGKKLQESYREAAVEGCVYIRVTTEMENGGYGSSTSSFWLVDVAKEDIVVLYGPSNAMMVDTYTGSRTIDKGEQVDFAFKENGNFVSADKITLNNKQYFENAGFFVGLESAVLETGENVSFYRFVATENTPYGEYTANLTVNGETKQVVIIVEKFVWDAYGFPEDAALEVPRNGTYTIPLVNGGLETDTCKVFICYTEDDGDWIRYPDQSVLSVNYNAGKAVSVTFDGAAIMQKCSQAADNGYFFVEVETYQGTNCRATYGKTFQLIGETGEEDGGTVYYNINGEGWEAVTDSNYVLVEPQDIVQVKVIQNGVTVRMNETKFEYDGNWYWYGVDYIDSDVDGKVQTMYISPDDYQENGGNGNRLVMKNTTNNIGEWYFDFAILPGSKELTNASNYIFSKSTNDSSYASFGISEEVVMEPGGRVYLKLHDRNLNKEIRGSEAAVFSAADDWDKIHITYIANDRWCIDAGANFTGTDEITMIYNGQKYGPVKINVTENAGGGGNLGDSYVEFYDDILKLPESGQAKFPVKFSLSGSQTTDMQIGLIDYDYDEFYPFTEQEGYYLVRDGMDNITEVVFDVDVLKQMYPDVYDNGAFTAALYVVDGNNRWLSSCTGVHFSWFAEGEQITPYTGTVQWRLAGEEAWKTVSVGQAATEWGVIDIELFDILEIKMIDEDGKDFTAQAEIYNKRGQGAYGFFNQQEGGYLALTHPTTRILRNNNGKCSLELNNKGVVYQLNYTVNSPDINQPAAEFDGYAMAVTGDHENPVYVSFDDFIAPAYNETAFGIQFYDKAGDPVAPSRVQPVIADIDNGFDIKYGTDYDRENAQWIYESWEVIFNGDARGGRFAVDFVIDGTKHAQVIFDAEGDYNGPGPNDPYAWFEVDDGIIRLPENGKYTVGVLNRNLPDGLSIGVKLGYFDYERDTFVPFNNNTGIDKHYDPDTGLLCAVTFDVDELAEAYPDNYDEGRLMASLTSLWEDGSEGTFVCTDVYFAHFNNNDNFWVHWDWNFDNGSFAVPVDGQLKMDIIKEYEREGWTAEVLFGYVDEENDYVFVPYDEQAKITTEDADNDGVPDYVIFDGAEIIKTYPWTGEQAWFHIAIVEYRPDGEKESTLGCDVRLSGGFDYRFDEEDGELFIYDGPEVITAEVLNKAFAGIAKDVTFLYISGVNDGGSGIRCIEGSKVLAAFPNLEQMNIFGMEYIDDNAFASMPKLDYVYMHGIKELGDGVFSDCRALDGVHLGNVEKFGVNTFKGCTQLKSAGTDGYGWFDITFSNQWIETDNGMWINPFPENVLTGSSVKEVNVKNYTHLSKDAFKGLNLDSLVMDQMMEVIDNAFTDSTIDTVYYQGDKDQFYAQIAINGDFAYQKLVDNYIYIIDRGNAGTYYGDWEYGNEVTYTFYSDGQLVFRGNGAIGEAAEFEMYEDGDWSYIEAYAPWIHHTAERIVIEHGVTGIGKGAFASLWLYEVIIPDTVTTIGDYAFANGGFTQMVMPKSITSAGTGVFKNAEQIENIWFGGTAPQWGALFGTGDMAAAAVIPESTTTISIPDYAIEAGIKLKMEGDERIATSFENVPVGSSFHIVPTMGITAKELWVNGWAVYGDYFTPNTDNDIGIIFEESEPVSGKAGANATWTYDDGVLVISGTGATYNYDFYDRYTAGKNVGMAPWADLEINRIIVKEGITALGDSNILPTCLETLQLPSTLKTIGKWNFVAVEMEEIVFPENLTAIGSDSFNETAINRIVFNDKLTTIGRESFQNMHSCTFGEVVGDEVVRNYIDITIPASVTSIGEGAFTDGGYEREYYNEDGGFIGSFTSTLRSITVDPDNKNYKVENGALMTKDGKLFIALPAAAKVHNGQYIPPEDYSIYDEFDGIYTVPYGVETLGYRALSSHSAITGINLPNTLKKVNERAFSNLGIRNIVLPDNLTTLAENVFEWCWELEAVQFGKNIRTINKAMFGDCSLDRIDIRKDNPYLVSEDGFVTSKDGKILYMVTSDAYRWNYMDESYIVVPYGVTTIAEAAFGYMQDVNGIELPNSVTTIQKFAFRNAKNLSRIMIPASVKTIDPTAFNWCGIRDGIYNRDDELVEEGWVYYGGTDAQWKAIAAKINPQNVQTNCNPEGKLIVDSEGYTAEERKAFVLYEGETITETFEMYVEMFGNPITGEESTHDHPMLTWKMNEYGEAFNAEFDNDYVTVTITEPGTYEFMAYNGNNPKNDQVKFTYVVKDMADAVELTVANGAYTREGTLVAARGATVTPKINWIDGLAWDIKDVHTTEFTFSGNLEHVVFNEKTGVVKIAKDAPGGIYELTYTAERYDEEGNWIGFIEDTLEILVVEELVTGIELLNGDHGYMNGAPIGNKIVLDKEKGITSFTIEAHAVNDADYKEIAFTSTANENFTVVDNGDNTATVTLIGDTGNVTVTATAMDGSKKSAKVTFTAGIAMEELHITHTLPVVEAEAIPANESITGREIHAEVVILAKGKTATLTAEMLPSAPTNKGVTWVAETIRNDEGNENDVVEIKNGKITTKAEGVAQVIAVAQDGTPCADIVYVRVLCPAEAVELVSDIDPIKGKVDAVDGVKAGKGTITIGDEVGSVTLVAEPVADGHVYEGVQWSISGGIAKYVTYDITGPVYDAQGELVELPKATFYADRPGDFTVKAVADDGTKVAATYKITVAQVPYAMEVTKLSGSKGEYTENGLKAFILKGDFTKPTTVLKATPTVVFNNGDKTDVVKAPFNSYSVYVNDEIIESGKLEFTAPGLYTVKLVADHRPSTSTTFIVDVRDNTAVELESLELSMPKGMATGQAVAGKTYKISALLNGQAKIDTSKINVEWSVMVLNGSADNVSINNGTLDLKNAKGGEAYLVQLKLTDKKDAENVIMAGLAINVKAPLVKNNLWLGLEETVEGEKVYTDITKLGDRLNAVTGTLETIKVLDLDGANISSYQFDVKSSNPKVLDVEKVKNDTFNITAKDDGKVNLTISALDGSGYKQTIAVTVKTVPSPVNKITVAGAASAAYTVGMQQSIVVPYGLESKVSTVKAPVTPVSFTEMEWTSSDNRIATVDNLGADVNNVTSVTAKNGNITYTTNGQVVITTGSLAGKATITGTALDGSGKTVKINVTVAASGVTNEIHLNAPANAATGGETDGTVVLTWGKTMKLTATVLPNKAKNKVINYTIEGVAAKGSDVVTATAAELEALGVTVNKTGTVAAKAANKALANPYVGWVKVTATLNYGFAQFNGENWTTETIEDAQYIFIDRPVQSIKFTTFNAQGKVVNAPTNETIKKAQIEDGPISFKLTEKYTLNFVNKGYTEKGVDLTTKQSVYGTYDNLLWTTSNADLATVSDDGTITVNQFTKAGSVKITAKAQDGSNVKYTYTIKITK